MNKLFDKILRNTGKEFSLFDRILYGAILTYFIESFIPDQDGKIKTNQATGATMERMKDSVNKSVGGAFDSLIASIVGNVLSFFGKAVRNLVKFDVRAIEKSGPVMDALRKQSSTTAKTVINLEIIYADIKQRAIALMSRPDGISLKDLRKELETVIVDKKIMTRYYGRWTHDIYSQYERIASNTVRKELGLRFAIYQGGTIETSRDFCEERNGKVFHEDEILAWETLSWEGKPETGYNAIADLGGYNCRHRLDWISDELAFRLRPELRKKYQNAA